MSEKVDSDALVASLNRIRRFFGDAPLSIHEETELRTTFEAVQRHGETGKLPPEEEELIRKNVLAKLDPKKINN